MRTQSLEFEPEIACKSLDKRGMPMVVSRIFRYVLAAATGTMLLLLTCGTAQSQDLNVSPSESDGYAASQAQNVRLLMPGLRILQPGRTRDGQTSPTCFRPIEARVPTRRRSSVIQATLNITAATSCSP